MPILEPDDKDDLITKNGEGGQDSDSNYIEINKEEKSLIVTFHQAVIHRRENDFVILTKDGEIVARIDFDGKDTRIELSGKSGGQMWFKVNRGIAEQLKVFLENLEDAVEEGQTDGGK